MTTLVAPVVGPLLGRLDHRQHLLALDLLHQHAGRHRGFRGDLVDIPKRETPLRAAGR